MKNFTFITKDATKYWKKEVSSKKGRLQIATNGDKIYIVNSYNAFIIPNNAALYALLVQPATLMPAPEDGAAHIWINGDFRKDSAASTVSMIENTLSASGNPVSRSGFIIDGKNNDQLRVFKLSDGSLSSINIKYDAMLDFSLPYSATMKNTKAPAVFRSGDFTGILLPVFFPELSNRVRDLLGV